MMMNGKMAAAFGEILDNLKKIVMVGVFDSRDLRSRLTGASVEVPGFVRREFRV